MNTLLDRAGHPATLTWWLFKCNLCLIKTRDEVRQESRRTCSWWRHTGLPCTWRDAAILSAIASSVKIMTGWRKIVNIDLCWLIYVLILFIQWTASDGDTKELFINPRLFGTINRNVRTIHQNVHSKSICPIRINCSKKALEYVCILTGVGGREGGGPPPQSLKNY